MPAGHSTALAHYCNLAEASRRQGRLDDAIAAYEKAIELKPDAAELFNNLGNALRARGRLTEAVSAFHQAIGLNPSMAEAHCNLGMALKAIGRLDEAIAAYAQAIRIRPNLPQAHNNMGNALREQGKLEQAIKATATAIELQPALAEAHNNLGNIFLAQEKLTEAIAAFTRAIQCKPAFAEAHYNLARVLHILGQLDNAAAEYSTAIALQSDHADAHNNLGNILTEQGLYDEALGSFDRAIACSAENAGMQSNRLYTFHLHPRYDAQSIYDEHRKWNRNHAARFQKLIQPHHNAPNPGRRLRIGYVSPDLRDHPAGRFLLPLFDSHDGGQFEIFCYSGATMHDAVTSRLRSNAHCWRDVAGMSDQQLSEQIRRDDIDILVDLSLHSAHNRLLVFARKPAPVQVTYLGYCSTTGLDAIDYRITDPYLDPPGLGDAHYSEKTIRLPDTWWCYKPSAAAPEDVAPLPALASGRVTFGCLNNFAKVSAGALALWCRLLLSVPQSRLVLHAREGGHRTRAIEVLRRQEIDPARLSFVGLIPAVDYFRVYHQIDIGLDPFPFAGGATTCDALWMGVPVVTLAARTAVGRAGVSILSNVGLPQCIAGTEDEYLRAAQYLAGNLPRLGALRASLRMQMQQSPLMDAPRLARHIEAAYREMWQRWISSVSRS